MILIFLSHISSQQHFPGTLGGIYQDGAILTDPVVQSQNERFGPTDLGNAGAYVMCFFVSIRPLPASPITFLQLFFTLLCFSPFLASFS